MLARLAIQATPDPATLSIEDGGVLDDPEKDDEEHEHELGLEPVCEPCVGGAHGASLCVVHVGDHSMSAYSDLRFEAVCRRAHHNEHGGRCRLTRSSCESRDEDRRSQGRPLGLMTAWLLRCDGADGSIECASKEEHESMFFVEPQP